MINDYPKIEKKPLKVKGCKYDPKKYPTYDNYMALFDFPNQKSMI